MTIIRVFPQRTSYTPTDDLAFVGDPPFPAMQPKADEVHVSVTFTWDINEGKRLAEAWSRFYPVVKLGGPAIGSPAEEFVSGKYVRTGYTFTSRGCIRKCPFCFVPQREGLLRELADFPVGNLVNDNNLLACSEQHIRRVFAMLKTQKDVEFPGGLDVRIIKPWHVEAMRELDVHQLFLAYDGAGQRDACAKAVAMLRAAGFTQRQVRIYMLVGFQEDTPELALARLEDGFAMGGLPFAMRYRDENGKYRIDPAYHELCRTWTRPAATFAAMKE